MRPLAKAGSSLAILGIVSALLAGSATVSRGETAPARAADAQTPQTPTPTTARTTARTTRAQPDSALAVPAALTDGGPDLRGGPAPVPLELQMPSLDVGAAIVGVGMTRTNVMDAPMGRADDPVWQQAFWYRGSAVPGALSTALIAGHVSDPLGRAGVFAHIGDLRPGDPIVVRDTRTGLDVRFSVTDSKTYSLAEATEPVVLTEIYGAGPVAGTEPQPSVDGLSHLTLISCTGIFRNGTHDHRLVVYATRIA